MARVVIKNEQNELILESELINFSPLGFECEITQETTKGLRDKTGKFVKLSCELYLETNFEPVCILGGITVSSIRRCSQNISLLTARFINLDQQAYRYIAEFADHGKVVSISRSASKRRA